MDQFFLHYSHGAYFITEPNRRGIANGMNFSAIDLGIGLSGIVFGFFATFIEIATIFQISSLFILIVTVLVFLSPQEKHFIKEQKSAS